MSVALLNGYLDDFWAAYDAREGAAAITAQDALFRGITDWDAEPEWDRYWRKGTSGFRLFLEALSPVSSWAYEEGASTWRLHSRHDWIGLVDADPVRSNPSAADVRVGAWWRDNLRGERTKIKLVVSDKTVYHTTYPRDGGAPYTTAQAIDAFLRTHDSEPDDDDDFADYEVICGECGRPSDSDPCDRCVKRYGL